MPVAKEKSASKKGIVEEEKVAKEESCTTDASSPAKILTVKSDQNNISLNSTAKIP